MTNAIVADDKDTKYILSALDSYARLFAYSDYDKYKDLLRLRWRIELEFEATKKGDLIPKVTYE